MRDQSHIDALKLELNAKKAILAALEVGAGLPGDLFLTRGWGVERRMVRISAELYALDHEPGPIERFGQPSRSNAGHKSASVAHPLSA